MNFEIFSTATLQKCRIAAADPTTNANSNPRLGPGVDCQKILKAAENVKSCSSVDGNAEICDAALRRRGHVKHAPER